MNCIARKIDKLGRIVLPMDYRRALRLGEEATVFISVENNSIVIKGCENYCRLCGTEYAPTDSLPLCSACVRRIKNSSI